MSGGLAPSKIGDRHCDGEAQSKCFYFTAPCILATGESLGAIHILRHAGVGGGGYTNIVTKRDAKI